VALTQAQLKAEHLPSPVAWPEICHQPGAAGLGARQGRGYRMARMVYPWPRGGMLPWWAFSPC